MNGKPRSKAEFREWDAPFVVRIGQKKIDLIAIKAGNCEAARWETAISLQKNRKLYSNQSFLIYIQDKIIEKVDDLRAMVQQ
jgi:hypothetical protein